MAKKDVDATAIFFVRRANGKVFVTVRVHVAHTCQRQAKLTQQLLPDNFNPSLLRQLTIFADKKIDSAASLMLTFFIVKKWRALRPKMRTKEGATVGTVTRNKHTMSLLDLCAAAATCCRNLRPYISPDGEIADRWVGFYEEEDWEGWDLATHEGELGT